MSFPNSENSGVNVKRMGENSNRKCFRTEVNARMLHFFGEFFVVVLWGFLWVCWGFFQLPSYEAFKKYSKTEVVLLVSSGITLRPVHRDPALVGQIQFTELHISF